MPTEMELTLEQTQQGVSYEVSSFALSGDVARHQRWIHSHRKMENCLSQTSNKLYGRKIQHFSGNSCQEGFFLIESIDTCQSSGIRRVCKNAWMECQVLKLKNFKKDATLKLFKNGMSMSVQKSQRPQGGKATRWRRDCAWLMISSMLKITQLFKYKFKVQAQSRSL
ncbi:hypothetical protein Tco_0175272 [Tanacetum coccineum]